MRSLQKDITSGPGQKPQTIVLQDKEKKQRQICKAYILAYLPEQKRLMWDVPLNVNFALSEPVLGAAAMQISALTKFDEYSVCIVMIRMQYEISNNVH